MGKSINFFTVQDISKQVFKKQKCGEGDKSSREKSVNQMIKKSARSLI
jgi:hypothetical protein